MSRKEFFYDFEADEPVDAVYMTQKQEEYRVWFLLLSLLLAAILLIQCLAGIGGKKEAQTEADQPNVVLSINGSLDLTELGAEDTELTTEQKLSRIHSSRSSYPSALITLADQEPMAVDFVYYYPELSGETITADLTAEAMSSVIPTLFQWDIRWGYQSYGSGMLALTGSGPTCLSMAAIYLTKNADYTPGAVASYAEESGYYSLSGGTAWGLMSEGSKYFGLTPNAMSVDEEELQEALRNGYPVICVMNPGDFTETSDYILIADYSSRGYTIHDPNSAERTQVFWSYEELASQIGGMWYFT